MIVVIDTNVWVSALQFGRTNSPPIRSVEKILRWHTLATSDEINAEIRCILERKFRWSPDEAQRLIASYFKRAIHVNLSGTIHVCRDPNDDMILECAVISGAECIVPGDHDLLALDPYCGIRILTPAQFLIEEA